MARSEDSLTDYRNEVTSIITSQTVERVVLEARYEDDLVALAMMERILTLCAMWQATLDALVDRCRFSEQTSKSWMASADLAAKHNEDLEKRLLQKEREIEAMRAMGGAPPGRRSYEHWKIDFLADDVTMRQRTQELEKTIMQVFGNSPIEAMKKELAK